MTTTQRPIVVFGSINRDVRLAAARIARPGETVGDARMTLLWGGKGANQAVAAARLGGRVRLVGAVGEGATGRDALGELDREGVDRRHVRTVPGTPTGTAVVLVDEGGDNAITVAPGANAEVRAADLEPALAQLPAGVLVTGFELPAGEVLAAASLAAAAGWEVIVNPAPAVGPLAPGWPRGAVFTPNRHELAALTGTRDVERAVRLLADRVEGTVIATVGAAGAVLAVDGRTERIAAPRVRAVDTTGAGDAFNGALAWSRANDVPLPEAVRTAVTAAAFSTEREGARGGMVTERELTERRGKG